MDEQDLKQSAEAQCDEIMRYKWYLGIQSGHDPLEEKSMNEICCEWIKKHSDGWRKNWVKPHKLPKTCKCSD